MLENIRIILIDTFHPGNIGSAARAMKTMGLSDLWLVRPRQFPDSQANSLAAGALDVLKNAHVVSTLDEATADCSMVVGTSARIRHMDIPLLETPACAEQAVKESEHAKVAVVFGQETHGMTNEELLKCHYHVFISANPVYPVMNVAASIQIFCYEIWQAWCRMEKEGLINQDKNATPHEVEKYYPPVEQMEMFYAHLEQALDDVGFIVRQHPGMVMQRMRRLFNRARPETQEMNMLRGMLSAMQKAGKEAGKNKVERRADNS
ncbi:tRNA (cytidine/uridine-2'-O-)-methyltransferase TrmJ [invertebrate metagenome]|uniref:tRNA (Cytidine/uridine-2'-O-)-methyltransferase TrmJ n=1 Tax=invertebrate metagenome TaxID=1711999 RepID=A0A2H9T639_9ZZZZ